jgi:hypothetical protein
MGVTVTHTLPPLKRGGLGGEAQFVAIPTVISVFFHRTKTVRVSDTAKLADALPS